jgi:ribonuclease BN (tRNA processing enzyme)
MKHLTDEHLSPEAVGKMAARASVKMVVLTGLPFSGKQDDDYQRFVDEVARHYQGKVIAAKSTPAFNVRPSGAGRVCWP